MAQAQGSKVELAYIPEVTFGETPATPATKLIEFVSFNGNLVPNQLSDPSIRSDRQVAYSRRGNSSTEGQLEVVMAPDNYDFLLEAALQGAWTTNALKIGSTQRSFAIEQSFVDIDQHRVFNGVVVNTMSMEITTDSLVKATFGLMGKSTTPFSQTRIDESPDAITSKDKFYHEGGTFNEGGVAVGYLSALSFELNNNVTGNNALGVVGVRSMTSGKVNVTGSVTGLFESVALYNKFKDNTDTSLSFTLVAGLETLQFTFHKVKYTSGNITMNGDAGVTVELAFEALYDSTALNTLTVTRSA